MIDAITDNREQRWCEVVEKLMQFQYEYLGMGRLRCRSCGALGYEDHDEGRVDRKVEPCSPVCPWEKARLAIWVFHTD